MSAARPRVAVVYDSYPHYRKGVIEALAASTQFEYIFFGDPSYRSPSIRNYQFPTGIRSVQTRSFMLGPLHVQRGILRAVLRERVEHCIFLGNPRFASYWFLAPLLRLLGKRVYFWSHGWLDSRETRLRGFLKHRFYHMADALLLYGKRARRIGLARGFRPDRLYVIGNSLDYAAQRALYEELRSTSAAELRRELELPATSRILICTARVIPSCRFDLLIQAASELRRSGHDVFLLIVGDGPEVEALTQLARSLDVPHRFWGACYDERVLARLYKASDLTVSPGKVGLTAVHSMAYGTPVITHDNFDRQGPEHEAISRGRTGDFFTENSSADLARVIARWLGSHPEKPERACIECVESQFTPAFQRRAIESALQGLAPAA